ncbi:MAG: VOC family protein [Planctomycetota bacterium]|nr:MAG: VOC family protein [Planctomycetota bacterium]
MTTTVSRELPSADPLGPLDSIHHVAIAVRDVAEAVNWYRKHFRCDISYQDATWALLLFSNTQLALVIPDQHPPHIGFIHPKAEEFGPLKGHRDGTRSCYVADPSGNPVEVLAPIS